MFEVKSSITELLKHHYWSKPYEITVSVGRRSAIPYGSTYWTGALPTCFIPDLDWTSVSQDTLFNVFVIF